MKVAQIITRSDDIGGAQIHVRDLSLELLKRGIEVHVLAGGSGVFADELQKAGIPVQSVRHLIRPVRPIQDWRAFWELRSLLRALRPDLVATHSSKAGLLGRLAAASLGIPAVFTAHGWAFTDGVPLIPKLFYLAAEKWAGLFTSRIITVSRHDRLLSEKYRVIPSAKVITVPNGIPDVSFLDVPITNHGDAAMPRFVMTARMARPKNHLLLLEALSRIRDCQWELELIGDGPLRPEIEKYIKIWDISSKINVLGERRDVAERLREAQGFILISDWEGLPLSILEAMRAGLPIIASAVGGIPELVEDGVNGFLIPRGDADVLTERLNRLINDARLRVRMGIASREKYEREYQLAAMVEQTLCVYHTVLVQDELRACGL